MAGAFSGHLLNAFGSAPGQSSASNIITSGAMSFDSRAHGTPAPSPFSSLPTSHPPFCFAPSAADGTAAKNIATLQAKLNKKLGPEYISQRPGPGGGPKLTYAEGWKIINLANEVFGFNGWNSSIVSIATDFVDYSEESKRFSVGVTAIVRVTLRDGTYHEDVGYGLLENSKSKAAALDKCKKEAITDALKRTLRNFGNLLGNCLYDKSYAQEVVKIKVPPAKFDKSELYRRPEFEDTSVNHGQNAVPGPSSTDNRVKTEHEDHQAEIPITYVPRHMRQEVAAAAQQAQASTRVPATPAPRPSTNANASASGSGSGNTSAIINRGPISVDAPKPNGLATPVQTPAALRPLPPRAPPSRPIATSPLARVRSAPERAVSFTEPMLPRANSTDTADQDPSDIIPPNVAEDDDDDAFPISTQDGALFATVDLCEGDLGRPIDYEEGMGGVSMLDTSVYEPGVDNAGLLPARPQLQAQVRDRTGGGGLSSGSTNTRTEVQKSSLSASGGANASPIPSTSVSSGQARPQPRSGATSPNMASPSTSTSSTRAGSAGQDIKRPPARPVTTSASGFHPAPTTKPSMQHQQQPQKHTPKPVPPASARPPPNTNTNAPQPGPSSTLKRTADMMHAGAGSGSGSSSRPPIQGTGVAHRQQQQQQQGAIARHPSDDNVGNDPKRLKVKF